MFGRGPGLAAMNAKSTLTQHQVHDVAAGAHISNPLRRNVTTYCSDWNRYWTRSAFHVTFPVPRADSNTISSALTPGLRVYPSKFTVLATGISGPGHLATAVGPRSPFSSKILAPAAAVTNEVWSPSTSVALIFVIGAEDGSSRTLNPHATTWGVSTCIPDIPNPPNGLLDRKGPGALGVSPQLDENAHATTTTRNKRGTAFIYFRRTPRRDLLSEACAPGAHAPVKKEISLSIRPVGMLASLFPVGDEERIRHSGRTIRRGQDL